MAFSFKLMTKNEIIAAITISSNYTAPHINLLSKIEFIFEFGIIVENDSIWFN